MTDAIRVQNLGKQFNSYHTDLPITFHKAIFGGFRRLRHVERFWALRNVSFSVSHTHMLGILGRNGAGKSTLMRLIGGVGKPDEGDIEVKGQISGLLELGAGFHPDLTGRDNTFINGVISGLTRRDVKRKFDEIVAFAELEKSIDKPLRTYSAGMRMRLSFAIAIHTRGEILLIDEVLAVGDVAFRHKCFERIKKLKSEGRTIVFISHNTNQIKSFCDKALWLHAGRVMKYGTPEEVVNDYLKKMELEPYDSVSSTKQTSKSIRSKLSINENSCRNSNPKILSVRLLDLDGLPVTGLNSGDPLRVEIEFQTFQPIETPIFGVGIYRKDHQVCCRTNTSATGLSLPTIQGREKIKLCLERLDLEGGKYYINVGIYEQNWNYTYDYHWNAHQFFVRPTRGDRKSILNPPLRWEIG
jgi:lipopolysaccharide transport system ATP-binding protein